MKIFAFLIVFLTLHAAPLDDALAGLKEATYGFAIFDVGITEEDLETFRSIDIRREWVYHHFGKITEEAIRRFMSEIGCTDHETALKAAARLQEIGNKVIEASGKEAAWMCLRSYVPIDRFDLPRWHVDGAYYTRNGPEDLLFKFVLTLVGPTTLFYPIPFELRKTTARFAHDRLYMKNVCKQEEIVSPELGQGAVFIAGSYTALTGLHSEPPIHEKRLFLSIVPCSANQLSALIERVDAAYPKNSRN